MKEHKLPHCVTTKFVVGGHLGMKKTHLDSRSPHYPFVVSRDLADKKKKAGGLRLGFVTAG